MISVISTFIIFPLIGGLIGFGWYKLMGCQTGACPVSANPWFMTAMGIAVGLLSAWSGMG